MKPGEVEPIGAARLAEAVARHAVFVEHRQIDPIETGMKAGAPNYRCAVDCYSACNFDPLSWGIGVQN